MKAIKCQMCDSTDFVKDGDYFVCQSCGVKYTVEDARKMMIDGTVDVQGTVKVDNSAFVEKYLQNARRAKHKEDWAETEKYYNMVEQNDPSNIEAIFYSAYGKAKTSLLENDYFRRKDTFKVLQNCVSIIDDNFDVSKEEEDKAIIEQISIDIFGMANGSYVYNNAENPRHYTVTLFNNLGLEFCSTLENIAKKISNENKTNRVFYYDLALKHAMYILNHGHLAKPKFIQEIIMKYHRLINECDPSHVVPSEPPKPEKSGGCYVATAVYGSYDCPEVWTLRRYRDYTLAKTWHGRAFIKTYYAISPTLVKWFGDTKWFKKTCKGKLDRMVVKLQTKGVDNSPYEDKKW